MKTEEPFDVYSDGDYSSRVIPIDTEVDDLEVTHIYYDTKHTTWIKLSSVPLPQFREAAEKEQSGRFPR
ncbi:hypothetical protein ACJROX_25560 [Pseudalkalibacillus sp. A8]|uniref:hypothetical protein n=1 Tax=Pseudalkalibacillus sp. A8 TaxID=3382641 RepID=UPI0038B4B0EA